MKAIPPANASVWESVAADLSLFVTERTQKAPDDELVSDLNCAVEMMNLPKYFDLDYIVE